MKLTFTIEVVPTATTSAPPEDIETFVHRLVFEEVVDATPWLERLGWSVVTLEQVRNAQA